MTSAATWSRTPSSSPPAAARFRTPSRSPSPGAARASSTRWPPPATSSTTAAPPRPPTPATTRASRPSSSTVSSKPSPTIQTASFNGTAVISGGTSGFTATQANNLALELRYGSLPVRFTPQSVQTVSATIGKDSLKAGLLAGLGGIIVVLLYMILYYRALGLVVVVGLGVGGALLYSIITQLSQSASLALTLSGVTGIIVSIGITVDSYVVYFERLEGRDPGRTDRPPVGGAQLRPGLSHRAHRRLRHLPGRADPVPADRRRRPRLRLHARPVHPARRVHRLLLHPARRSSWSGGGGPSPRPASSGSPAGSGPRPQGGRHEPTAGHNAFQRLFRGETSFDFAGRWRRWFAISGLVILIGLISLGRPGAQLLHRLQGRHRLGGADHGLGGRRPRPSSAQPSPALAPGHHPDPDQHARPRQRTIKVEAGGQARPATTPRSPTVTDALAKMADVPTERRAASTTSAPRGARTSPTRRSGPSSSS